VEDKTMFPMLVANFGALSVAAIYYAWRDGYHRYRQAQDRKVLRERVAYMLWAAADRYA
jgi:hypothetical protein